MNAAMRQRGSLLRQALAIAGAPRDRACRNYAGLARLARLLGAIGIARWAETRWSRRVAGIVTGKLSQGDVA